MLRFCIIIYLSLSILSCNNTDDFQSLQLELEKYHEQDQKLRVINDSLAKEGLWNTDLYRQNWTKIKKSDSILQYKLDSIVALHGWIDSSNIGQKASTAMFLIVQHADSSYQEKYIPLLRKSVERNQSKPSHLALLQDRLDISKGKAQTYGSQLLILHKTNKTVFSHIQNVEKIDSVRHSVGLDSISAYAQNFGIEWSLESYYLNLLDLESELDSIANLSYPKDYYNPLDTIKTEKNQL